MYVPKGTEYSTYRQAQWSDRLRLKTRRGFDLGYHTPAALN